MAVLWPDNDIHLVRIWLSVFVCLLFIRSCSEGVWFWVFLRRSVVGVWCYRLFLTSIGSWNKASQCPALSVQTGILPVSVHIYIHFYRNAHTRWDLIKLFCENATASIIQESVYCKGLDFLLDSWWLGFSWSFIHGLVNMV